MVPEGSLSGTGLNYTFFSEKLILWWSTGSVALIIYPSGEGVQSALMEVSIARGKELVSSVRRAQKTVDSGNAQAPSRFCCPMPMPSRKELEMISCW